MARLERRTNALGSAKADCHTCARSQRRCDRQRPHCSQCRAAKQICGGYILNLTWKPQKQPEETRPLMTPRTRTGISSSNRTYQFLKGQPKVRKQNRRRNDALSPFVSVIKTGENHISDHDHSSTPNLGWQASVVPTHSTLNAANNLVEICSEWPQHSVSRLCTSLSAWSETFPPVEALAQPDECWAVDDNNEVDTNFHVRNERTVSAAAYATYAYLPLSTGVQYRNLAHQAHGVLEMYDQEFCVLPLTMDCPGNPFRVRKDSCEASAYLLHAILAISAQHLAKKRNSQILARETQTHQATALRLFGEALSSSPAFSLLDTLLILVHFEATQTAASTWSIHLGGARRILDSVGIENACLRNSRTRAQIAMLIWWDITVALMARKEPQLPLRYLEILLEHNMGDDWTFFGLNGCLVEFVLIMARLAKLASIYEKVLDLEWTTFNKRPVEDIITEAEQWQNPDAVLASNIGHVDDDPNLRRSRYHCTEAWRHAVILYAYRVFSQDQDANSLRSIAHLARVILDHVRCIPKTAIMQKQVLLPIFLAGAEVGDDESRLFIRQYCIHWSSTSRFAMFLTVLELLQQIWEEWDVSTRATYWWGLKTGNRNISYVHNQSIVATELLLG